MARYVLEGEWTGYTSAQRRVVHREVVDGRVSGKRRINRLRALHAIVYTDGTSLNLSLRLAKPREKIVAILAYRELIREAEMLGKSRVLVSELTR